MIEILAPLMPALHLNRFISTNLETEDMLQQQLGLSPEALMAQGIDPNAQAQ